MSVVVHDQAHGAVHLFLRCMDIPERISHLAADLVVAVVGHRRVRAVALVAFRIAVLAEVPRFEREPGEDAFAVAALKGGEAHVCV